MVILKAFLLLSAGITVILRLFTYNHAQSLDPATIKLLNIISIVSAVVCLVCALVWICIIKIKEKKNGDKKNEE